MNCSRARELIDKSPEATPASPAQQTLEIHLASCAQCREELALLLMADSVLSTEPDLDLPPGLAEKVMREATARRLTSRSLLAPRHLEGLTAVGLATTAVVICLAIANLSATTGFVEAVYLAASRTLAASILAFGVVYYRA